MLVKVIFEESPWNQLAKPVLAQITHSGPAPLSLTGSAVEAGCRPGGGAVRDAPQQPGEKDVVQLGPGLPGGRVKKGQDYLVGGFTQQN